MAIMMAFNEQVQEDVRRMEQFNMIMRNVKPLMTIGQGKNMKVITATSILPFSLLRIDKRYQGMRPHPQIDKLMVVFTVNFQNVFRMHLEMQL